MSEDAASADSLLRENANLRRALALAEDEQRRLMAENAQLRAALDQAAGAGLARDALLVAIEKVTIDEAVRTAIRRAREEPRP